MAHAWAEGARRGGGSSAARPLKMVCFRLAGQRFGIAVERVAEVIELRPLTRVPFTPSAIAGIINLRGDIVTVVDLGDWLGLGPTRSDAATRIVVVRAAGRLGGVLVDAIDEMRTVDAAALEPAPPLGGSRAAASLAGVVTLPPEDEGEPTVPIGVLDMESVFASEDLVGAGDRREGGVA